MIPRATPLLSVKQLHLVSFGILVLLIFVAGFYLHTNVLPVEAGYPKNSQDFLAFYTASILTLDGQATAVYDPIRFFAQEQQVIPGTKNILWFYPPTYLLMTWPLALTDYLTSQMLFFASGVLLFFCACHLWLRTPALLFAVAAFIPVFFNLTYGQNGLFTASFMLFGLFFMHGRPWLAGFFISLLVIKPHLGVLIPIALLAGGYYRVFTWSALFSVAWVALSWWCFGSEPWLAFLDKLSAAGTHLNAGKLALSSMISVMVNMRQLGLTTEHALLIHALYALPFLLLLIVTWRLTSNPALQGASLGLATLVLSPYLFDYDLTWQALPIGLLALHASQTGWLKGESSVLTLAWLLPLVDLMVTLTGLRLAFPYSLWPIMNLFLLWVLHRRLTVHSHLAR